MNTKIKTKNLLIKKSWSDTALAEIRSENFELLLDQIIWRENHRNHGNWLSFVYKIKISFSDKQGVDIKLIEFKTF